MADGKWIPELTADTPLSEAARRALKVRLHVVRDHLPLAVEQGDRDPEHVHQLRVATRRAGAALRIFGDCLAGKALQRAKKLLRRLRRAAGEARDWDVFLADALGRGNETPAAQRPGLHYLFGYAAGQRAVAQAHLTEVGAEEGRGFDAFVGETLDNIRPPDKQEETLGALARTQLAQLLDELEQKAAGDLSDYAHLHQVRIAGKRLRYAMELFAGCFDESFKEELYPRVEDVQERLGRANDSHVAAQRLEAVLAQGRPLLGAAWKTLRPGVAGLLRFHRQRLPRERRAFLAWWEGWRKDGGPAVRALLGPEATAVTRA
jgi:CHAD domain-containing protein